MKICYETVRNSEEIRTYITQADAVPRWPWALPSTPSPT